MHTFVKLEDTIAIIRLPKGVQKQVGMYRRGDRVYVPHSGGYIEVKGRIATQLATTNGAHATAHPDIQLIDFEMSSVHHWTHVTDLGAPCLRMK